MWFLTQRFEGCAPKAGRNPSARLRSVRIGDVQLYLWKRKFDTFRYVHRTRIRRLRAVVKQLKKGQYYWRSGGTNGKKQWSKNTIGQSIGNLKAFPNNCSAVSPKLAVAFTHICIYYVCIYIRIRVFLYIYVWLKKIIICFARKKKIKRSSKTRVCWWYMMNIYDEYYWNRPKTT